MKIFAGLALALCVGTAAAQTVTVPFVGCPSDGQTGPLSAPHGKPISVEVEPAVAAQLAHYQSRNDNGILAPRGWHCAGLYGSNGWILFVSPEAFEPGKMLGTFYLRGPVVQLSSSNGDTSGRFEVAKLVRRFFPKHDGFVRDVIAEGIEKPDQFPAGPFPADRPSGEPIAW